MYQQAALCEAIGVKPEAVVRKNKRAELATCEFGPWRLYPGGDLRSHTVTRAVSSAQRGLTTVFGMGTGVTPAV